MGYLKSPDEVFAQKVKDIVDSADTFQLKSRIKELLKSEIASYDALNSFDSNTIADYVREYGILNDAERRPEDYFEPWLMNDYVFENLTPRQLRDSVVPEVIADAVKGMGEIDREIFMERMQEED